LLKRELLRPVKIDLASHPTGYPHQVALRIIAGDDCSRIRGNRPLKVVPNKGVNLSVLHDYILKRVSYASIAATWKVESIKYTWRAWEEYT
jgi:hypothetical protein